MICQHRYHHRKTRLSSPKWCMKTSIVTASGSAANCKNEVVELRNKMQKDLLLMDPICS